MQFAHNFGPDGCLGVRSLLTRYRDLFLAKNDFQKTTWIVSAYAGSRTDKRHRIARALPALGPASKILLRQHHGRARQGTSSWALWPASGRARRAASSWAASSWAASSWAFCPASRLALRAASFWDPESVGRAACQNLSG